MTERSRVEAAADAMFHKLFRLFGRRERGTASEIEAEALRALEEAKREQARTDEETVEPLTFGPGFDCSQDMEFLA